MKTMMDMMLKAWMVWGLCMGVSSCSKGMAEDVPEGAVSRKSPYGVTPESAPAETPSNDEVPSNDPTPLPHEQEPEAMKVDPKCGGEDNPCPLEKWMTNNVGEASENEDLKRMAADLDQIARLAEAYPLPKKWNEGKDAWTKIASDGAKAARAGDFKLARKSCKGCHKPWRKLFQKSEFRTQPLPKGWPAKR